MRLASGLAPIVLLAVSLAHAAEFRRFDGRFEGDRFVARGAMLSTPLANKLRDCSMALTRVQATGGPAPREPAAAAAPPHPQPASPAAVANAEEASASAAASAPVKVMEGKELNFTKGNDAAVIHAKLSRSTPHRYPVAARKGQTLTVKLLSDGGARLDIYEPGASLDMQANGFVVQGTRIKGAVDGAQVSADLPSDGKYLVLVRSVHDEASYTLEVAASRTPSSAESSGAFGAWPGARTDRAAARPRRSGRRHRDVQQARQALVQDTLASSCCVAVRSAKKRAFAPSLNER